jgi:hypothetical protein
LLLIFNAIKKEAPFFGWALLIKELNRLMREQKKFLD